MKIIAKIILGIVLLVLFLILLVLFVPIRYRASGSIQNKANVKGSISWLLHIVHLSVVYNADKPEIHLRIFGILLRPAKAAKSKNAKIQKNETAPEGTEYAETDENTKQHEQITTGAEHKAAGDTACDPGGQSKTTEDDGCLGFRKFLNLLAYLPQKIRQIIDTVRQTVLGLINTLRAAKDKAAYVDGQVKSVYEWWTQPDTEAAWAAVKRELKYQLHHICPRKLEADICFGTGDPASTGKLLGAIAMLYPFTKDRIHVTPDFEEKHLEGTFDVRGQLRIYKFLVTVIRLIVNPHVREAYHMWNARKAGNI